MATLTHVCQLINYFKIFILTNRTFSKIQYFLIWKIILSFQIIYIYIYSVKVAKVVGYLKHVPKSNNYMPTANPAPTQWILNGKFLPFCDKNFEKRIFCHKFSLFKKQITKNHHKIASNMKRYLISWISPNLGKYALWTITTTWATSQNWKEKHYSHSLFFIIKRKFSMLQTFSQINNMSILANVFFLNFLMLHQKWRSAPRGFGQIWLQDK